PIATVFPYTPLFRSDLGGLVDRGHAEALMIKDLRAAQDHVPSDQVSDDDLGRHERLLAPVGLSCRESVLQGGVVEPRILAIEVRDRKSTRLNSSHVK